MNASLLRLRERFDADPSDAVAFEGLEEGTFVAGEWNDLVTLYERRLEAPALAAEQHAEARAKVLLRLAQVLEERCLQIDQAIERYQEAIRLDPTLRPALVQLRGIYAARGQWELTLQVAETESALPMRPFERAAFATEMGQIWLERLGDAEHSLEHFERALAEQPDQVDALLGAATAYETVDDPHKAAEVLERAASTLRGADRAPALVRLARLAEGPLADPARATELYRRALEEDPRNEVALQNLVESAIADEDWPLFEELEERRFHLAAGAVRRLAIAHEAGRLHLERTRDSQAARSWFARALDLFPEDPVVHLALADLERLSGNKRALALHLKRAAELADNAAPVDVLRESAQLAREEGDDDLFVGQLRRALERRPDDAEVLEELAEALEAVGRDDELVEILEHQASLTPEKSPARAAAWLRLGRVFEERLSAPDRALAAYQAAAEADAAAPEVGEALGRVYRAREDYAALRAHLEHAAEAARSPEQSVAVRCALGDLLVEHFQDLDAARDCFAAAADCDPEDLRARQGLERIALALGDDEAIVEAFEREARVTSDRGRLSFLVWELARIFEEDGRRERALHWIERLVEAAPEDRRALQECARLQETLGVHTALCQTLERLDVLLQGSEQAANRRKLAELHAASGTVERAISCYRGALESDPDDVSSLTGLLAPLAETGRIAELVEIRRQLCALLPNDERAAARAETARLLADELGDLEGAVGELEAAVAEENAPPEAALRLEELLERSQRFEALEQRLAARREQLPDDSPEALALDQRRAVILLDRLHRPEQAAQMFRRIRGADPEASGVLHDLERALRQSNDIEGLVALLDEHAGTTTDPTERARLELERALLLEEDPARVPEAKRLLCAIADGDTPVAGDAQRRLRALLERAGDFDTLRDRMCAALGAADEAEQIQLRVELAALCRDRLADASGATEHLEAAVALDPGRAELWQGLARLYQEQERPADWLRALEAELETDPDPDRAVALRGRAAELALEPLGDLERATRHFESLLALEPGHAMATDFLAYRYEADARHAELAALLESQLSEDPEEIAGGADASRRLHIAALRAGPLEDLAGAITVLEPASRNGEALGLVAEPLADLYERAGQTDELVALSRRALAGCEVPGERANWSLRIGDALRAAGESAASAEAYRDVLADRPDDLDAECALRDLYRRLGENAPLVRLLEAQLARVGGNEEVPLRMELASLLAPDDDRAADALLHLRRVLEIDPDHAQALEKALSLSETLGRAEDASVLLELAIERTRNPQQRARLLARRGQLQAGGIGQPEDAVASLREALSLDPAAGGVRNALRELLAKQADWSGVLDCIEQEAAGLGTGREDNDARVALFEEAAGIAAREISCDASLAWLERLRQVCSDDATVVQRIAEVHRAADRSSPLLKALEDEIPLCSDRERLVALHQERAQLLEQRLAAPARAIAALEQARSLEPQAPEVLAELDRLYASQGRLRERGEVLDARIALASDAERSRLRREAATLLHELGRPEQAAHQIWQILAEGAGSAGERAELLGRLGAAFQKAGSPDLWVRAAEAELACLDPGAPVFAERRRQLHFELAEAYRKELARPERAARHLRILLDDGLAAPDGESAAMFALAETSQLSILRQRRNPVELERGLSKRLERTRRQRIPEEAEMWLELGHLRREQLHRPGGAAEAYREVLERDPGCLEAVRGWRGVAEQLGRSPQVVEALERELELCAEASPQERAAIHRKLGEVSWKKLDSTTRASRAFAAALEADPNDIVSLRSLQTLFEAMEDWRGALDLYESEVAVLGDREPERRQEIWLRVGALARDRAEDQERALRAYERAADLAPLPLPRQLDWADLYQQLEQPERFVEVFESWCDAEGSPAGEPDQLRLSEALELLGRREAALARCERLLEAAPESATAWDTAARLREQLGQEPEAAEALERAAASRSGHAAAQRRLRAAALVEASDPERARGFLERAVLDDPAHTAAHAKLARIAASQGRQTQAEEAAERALSLSAGSGPAALSQEVELETALAGAWAARHQDHLPAAARLFARVLELAPDHAEALAAQGDVLMQLGEVAAARDVLEACLAKGGDAAERAPRLVLLARALEAQQAPEEALEHYHAAIELDPALDEAQRRCADLLEREGRVRETVNLLQAWAARAAGPAECAARLLRAAELELRADDRDEPAEGLLREATSVAPDCGPAWCLLSELLWSQGRSNEALELSQRALQAELPDRDRARLAVVRGRALEQRGDRSAAADAYQAACAADPTCSEAALSGARLRRGLGDWSAAADLLRQFVHAAGPDETEGKAPALHQLGRLLAGPLEDVEGAIAVYRQALESDPELRDAKEALAELLVHRPDHWEEAVARHRDLLADEPVRVASLRGLLRVAEGRGSQAAVSAGLSLLRALGVATPDERIHAPARPSLPGLDEASLADPVWDAARRLCQEVASEIGEALGVGSKAGPEVGGSRGPVAAFRGTATALEGELSAPALVPLCDADLGKTITLVAQLCTEAESVSGDAQLVNGLSKSLGRRSRRRVRKAQGEISCEQIAAIEPAAFRAALRGMASARALSQTEVELRTAFLAWIHPEDSDGSRTIAPESDIGALVATSPEALALLRRLTTAWIAAI